MPVKKHQKKGGVVYRIVPTLRVGIHLQTLCVEHKEVNAERLARHYHAERGNDTSRGILGDIPDCEEIG